MSDPGYGANRKTTSMKAKVSYLKITIKFKKIFELNKKTENAKFINIKNEKSAILQSLHML